jgi:catechol 2,3-dioxygenase-like lactoylglutathione lyase family enzyme
LAYEFMEVSLGCSDAEEMAAFFERMFDGKVIFRGRMAGEPFARMVACGITFVFRQETGRGPSPPDPHYRDHLGLKVADMEAAIADLKARGAVFEVEPSMVKGMQQQQQDDGEPYFVATFVAEPLSLETLGASGYRHDVAIFRGPDGLAIELNEVHMPEGVDWF